MKGKGWLLRELYAAGTHIAPVDHRPFSNVHVGDCGNTSDGRDPLRSPWPAKIGPVPGLDSSVLLMCQGLNRGIRYSLGC